MLLKRTIMGPISNIILLITIDMEEEMLRT